MYIREQKTEELPGVRLMSLLKEHLGEILDREYENLTSIHLYCMGAYWVAFERSAYQLLQVLPRSMATPMSLTIYPFPIVMASLTDSELRAYCRRHPFRRKGEGYGRLTVPELSIAGYRKWHNAEVMDFPMP